MTRFNNLTKKFLVHCSETVFYEVEVEAATKEEAMNMIRDGEVIIDNSNIVDGENFEIDFVEEITKPNFTNHTGDDYNDGPLV